MNDTDICLFPKAVTVRLSGSHAQGRAVTLRFGMRVKNDYTYTVFIGANGLKIISDGELLESFDASRSTFVMDYADPRTEFAGRITARVLKTADLLRAREALMMYHKHLPYPQDYEQQLSTALTLPNDPNERVVELELHH